MRPILDIDLLRTFHAIARLGQFRAAAAFVNRSPAAVSVHIQRLEQVVGGRLLELTSFPLRTPRQQACCVGSGFVERT